VVDSTGIATFVNIHVETTAKYIACWSHKKRRTTVKKEWHMLGVQGFAHNKFTMMAR